jgi:hypothetical protein
MLWRSVTAMAFSANVFERVEIVGASGIEKDPARTVDDLFVELGRLLGSDMRSLDSRQYAGLVFFDGLSNAGAKLMDRVGELSDIVFIGGYAGDDRSFVRTVVYNDGEALENGVVFAVMKPRGEFRLIKTQSIIPTDKSLVATKVDPEARIIWEFDGRPAAQVYAEAMGIETAGRSADKFDHDAGRSASQAYMGSPQVDLESEAGKSFSERFINWPLAIMIDGEPFVRSAVTVVQGGGLRMYLPPIEGMRYRITRTADIAEETGRAIDEIRRELGGISAIVGVSCLLREIQVMNDDRAREFSAVFKDFPYVGLSSYGEVYVTPVNQTAVMLVFG